MLTLEHPELVFQHPVEAKKQVYPLERLLLILALLLWLADIAVRRLSLPWEKLVRWLIPRNQLKSVDQKKPSRDPIQAPTKAKDNVTDVGVPTMLQRGVEAAEQVETANNPEATAAAQTDRTSNQSNPSESLDKMNRLLAAKKRGSNKR